MNYSEINGDLFTAPQGYYLVHCISNDFALGAGIAKKFNEVFNMKEKLENLCPKDSVSDDGQDIYNYIGEALIIDNVFNLVTKDRYFHKPTYETLRDCLLDMKSWCERFYITKLAMPKIGSGLDKLEWEKVKDIIFETFEDSDINIVVYYL